MKVSRQDLYDRIWAEPMKDVAPQFGISGVALRKHCLKANIPVPERGYWARLAAGKSVIKVRLPARKPGQSDKVLIGENRYSYHQPSRDELLGPIPERPTFPEPIEAVEAAIVPKVGKVTLRKDLAAPHGAIWKLLDADEVRRQKLQQASWGYHWDKPKFESPFERRRLKILNTLFLALAKFEVKAEISRKEGRDIYLTVGDTGVRLYLDLPKNIGIDPRYQTLTVGDAGSALRLEIGGGGGKGQERFAWEDKASDKIETHLGEVAADVIVAGELRYREQLEANHNWWLERRSDLIERERAERAAAEKAEQERLARLKKERIDRLTAEAEDLRRADAIRQYVKSVRERGSNVAHADRLPAWECWTLEIAASIDPITTGRFLEGNDCITPPASSPPAPGEK